MLKKIFNKKNKEEINSYKNVDFSKLILGTSSSGRLGTGHNLLTLLRLEILEKVNKKEGFEINMPMNEYTEDFEKFLKEVVGIGYILTKRDKVIVNYNPMEQEKIQKYTLVDEEGAEYTDLLKEE